MDAWTLMVQGTGSDVGKSALVTGLCRVLHRRDVRVAPFKPQNMALNSVVTIDGGEIGRAQAVQAHAAGVPPRTDMNPVLLKPNSDQAAQVIIHGRALDCMDARGYHDFKPVALTAVLDSYRRLCERYEVVLVEGAGSPAEINLRAGDIANMGFAERVDCPVLLVGCIDRGGVFAQLLGTLALLSESERARVKGMVINRFRGDISLLTSGIDWLQARTGKPVFGVLPYLTGLHLEAEDGLVHDARRPAAARALRVVVPALPRISNHTDFDPLRLHPEVDVCYVGPGQDIPPADLIILPGSKSVRDDLAWLRANGWERTILRHLRYGGRVIGICGGFQMLGREINDPLGLEGPPGHSPGLGLLDLTTTLGPHKQLRNVCGTLALEEAPLTGYEIHAGVTRGRALKHPVVHLPDRTDGALSEDGQILGTYLHGVFESASACDALLRWAGLNEPNTADYAELREAGIDRMADAIEQHLDLKHLMADCLGVAQRRRRTGAIAPMRQERAL